MSGNVVKHYLECLTYLLNQTKTKEKMVRYLNTVMVMASLSTIDKLLKGARSRYFRQF